MSTTANALLLPTPAGLVPLDLLPDTALLPTFQANDRADPSTIQSDYSAEFEAPGTAHNHALLRHAAASQPTQGAAYVRLPCVLVSGGVETLPLGLLYLKGYKEGRYQLQLAGGNRRLVEALGDKTLRDLDLSRFNHLWLQPAVLTGLPFSHWQAQGWGYEVYDRGRAFDSQAVDPFALYPSCSFALVLAQVFTDAGFTFEGLADEPLFAALNVPAPNPYEFPQAYRDARALKAGYVFHDSQVFGQYDCYHHSDDFDDEKLVFGYVSRKPYHTPEIGTQASYVGGRYVADTLGFYDLEASVNCQLEINEHSVAGKIRVKFQLRVNGQVVYDANGAGSDEESTDKPLTRVYTPKLSRFLLHPGDYVELYWRGQTYNGASNTHWTIGVTGSRTYLPNHDILANEVSLSCTLLAEFPPGGLIQLQQWLPDVKQLDFVKTAMLLLGLTVMTDAYEPHLRLTPGNRLLANVRRALDWTAKRDAAAAPGRLPERELAYRFGDYAQLNTLVWEDDDRVTEGYGNGSLAVADEALDKTNELAKLPFAATLESREVAGQVLAITNFEPQDNSNPVTYTSVEAKPRLTLRDADSVDLSGQLVMRGAYTDDGGTYHPAELAPFTTALSYFAGPVLSLSLNDTVLTEFWADVKSLLQEARVVKERYRLTPQDVAELNYTIPIWDAQLGDYYCIGAVSEYDARRSVEVTLCRINAAHLPPALPPGLGLHEWYQEEFIPNGEFY